MRYTRVLVYVLFSPPQVPAEEEEEEIVVVEQAKRAASPLGLFGLGAKPVSH